MVRDYEALHAYLAARAKRPFSWGKHANDCVSHALGAVEAVTGRRLGGELPEWSSERGALQALKRLGGIEAAVDSVLRPIAPAMAQRGDVAGVRTEAGDLLLMVVEGETLVGPDASGARRLPRSRMTRAWSAE